MTITRESKGTAPPKWLNLFMSGFLRTPGLQRILGRSIALISFTGRHSGARYTIPVSYARDDGMVVILSRSSRIWWRNFETRPAVELRLAGKTFTGTAAARLVIEEDLATLISFLEKRPFDAKAYGVSLDRGGRLTEENARRLVSRVVIIRIRLDPAS